MAWTSDGSVIALVISGDAPCACIEGHGYPDTVPARELVIASVDEDRILETRELFSDSQPVLAASADRILLIVPNDSLFLDLAGNDVSPSEPLPVSARAVHFDGDAFVVEAFDGGVTYLDPRTAVTLER